MSEPEYEVMVKPESGGFDVVAISAESENAAEEKAGSREDVKEVVSGCTAQVAYRTENGQAVYGSAETGGNSEQ